MQNLKKVIIPFSTKVITSWDWSRVVQKGPPYISLDQPGPKRSVVMMCLNLKNPALTSKASTTLSTYTRVEGRQVDKEPFLFCLDLTKAKDVKVPTHLQDLFKSATKNCKESKQAEWLARLLTCYQAVVGKWAGCVKKICDLDYSISLKERARLIS